MEAKYVLMIFGRVGILAVSVQQRGKLVGAGTDRARKMELLRAYMKYFQMRDEVDINYIFLKMERLNYAIMLNA